MADLQDLKSFGEDASSLFQQLLSLVTSGSSPDSESTDATDAAAAKLQKLLDEWDDGEDAPLEDRAAAIVAQRTALTDLLIKAATSPASLDEKQALIVQAQRDSLRAAFGRLLELSALAPLADLLTAKDISSMSKAVKSAREGIQNKKTAQAMLDTAVSLAILASRIAVKLAA